MNHQRISEICFDFQVDGSCLADDDAASALARACACELRLALGVLQALSPGPGVWHRPVDAALGGRIGVSGWVERLGDSEVVFRVVGRQAGGEVFDRSLGLRFGAGTCPAGTAIDADLSRPWPPMP